MIKTTKLCDYCLKSVNVEKEAVVTVDTCIGYKDNNEYCMVEMHLCAYHAGFFFNRCIKHLDMEKKLSLTADMGWDGMWV